MTVRAFVDLLLALAAGAVGGGLAFIAGLPAPWLMGPTLLVAALALLGLRADMPKGLRDSAFAFIGLSIGSGIDENTLAQLPHWIPSLLAVPLCTLAVMGVSSHFLTRICGIERDSARMASSPGSLSYTLSLTLEGRGDLVKVLTIQSTRLFAMTGVLPPLLQLGTPPVEVVRQVLSLTDCASLFALCLPAGLLLSRFRVPVAYLIAGMLVSTAGHLTGLVHGVPPSGVSQPVYVVTGTVIGLRFTKIAWSDLKRLLPAALGAVLIAMTIAAAFAAILTSFTSLTLGQAWVALAPGGVEAMVAVALALGFDPTFVAAHHFLRIMLLSIVMPLWLGRRQNG
jgi:membrane AbrB-like protein